MILAAGVEGMGAKSRNVKRIFLILAFLGFGISIAGNVPLGAAITFASFVLYFWRT